MTLLLAALALLVPADGVNVPPSMLRIEADTPVTVYAPAVRIDQQGPVCADDDVPCIIRDVWPDQLEDRAVAIAWRESRFVATARNACCYGLFQIYFAVHRRWLCPDMAICTQADLLDARTNAEAALALYQKAGWAPWQT